MVCPPVREENPRALASGLSPVQADKPWYNYHTTPISAELAYYILFRAKRLRFLTRVV